MPDPRPPRAILTSFAEGYSLPGKPSQANGGGLDAYRQTGFLLGEELDLFERAIRATLSLVTASKPRGARAAAMVSVGSRAFAHLADACMLMVYGSYASPLALSRLALECLAIQKALVRDDFGPYEEWYQHAISQDGAAVRIDLGHSKASSIFAEDENLGLLYRLFMDLAMPHFGSALLFAAPETSCQKVPLAFADSSFHLGLAQLISGWLLRLSTEQLGTTLTSGVFPADDAAHTAAGALQSDVEKLLAAKRRCYVERIGDTWVFHNFRRSPSGQPRRIVLGP